MEHRRTREVIIQLTEMDCRWLLRQYGGNWQSRIAQHISNEIHRRKERWHGISIPNDMEANDAHSFDGSAESRA